MLTKFEIWRKESVGCLWEFPWKFVTSIGPRSGGRRGQSCTCWISLKAWQETKPTWVKRKRKLPVTHRCRALLSKETHWNGSEGCKGGGLALPKSRIAQCFKSWKGCFQLEEYGSLASRSLSWAFLINDKRFISAVQSSLQKCLLMNFRADSDLAWKQVYSWQSLGN